MHKCVKCANHTKYFKCPNHVTYAKCWNCKIRVIDDMRNIGVDVVRISPQSKNTDKIVNTFKDLSLNNINKDNAKKQLDNLSSSAFCDGYWFESPGMKNIELENIDN